MVAGGSVVGQHRLAAWFNFDFVATRRQAVDNITYGFHRLAASGYAWRRVATPGREWLGIKTLHVNYLVMRFSSLCLLFLAALVSQTCAQSPLVIDFNPDNGRGDVITQQVVNWPVTPARQIERSIDDVTIRLEVVGADADQLNWTWWKGGFDYGATLVSDGLSTVATGHPIRLSIKGLTPGRHSLVTWHNHVDAELPTGPVIVSHAGREQSVTPTHRVHHDDDAQAIYWEFEQQRDEVVEFVFTPRSDQRVVINAVALDLTDPQLQIRQPRPFNGDEHVEENPALTWNPPIGRTGLSLVAYDIYFGTGSASVQEATRRSPEYLGQSQAPKRSVQAADPLCNYYWRVDTLWSDGSTNAGKVQRLKIRALAFPGAEGYGRYAIGGRGGRVIEVTTLEDSGPGSLREAIEASGPRTVVFRVAGTIGLKSKLIIRNPYLTVAGQTAPGDGICVRGYTFGCLGTHDVILRYLRIRVGDESGETMDGTGFASTDHAIFDHCSISWSIDEAVSSRSAKNITLQRCIVAEALNIANHRKYQPGKGHSFAASVSGDIGSFHHNLLVHCAGRNWSLAGGLTRGGQFAGRLDIRNNVVYNWQHRTNDGGVKALNLVNNLYLPGPSSKVFHLLKPDAGSPADPQQYYVAGNAMEGRFEASGDNWRDAVQADPKVVPLIKLDQPFCESYVATHSTAELLENILADVGDNHAGWDKIDRRLIDEVRNRKTTFAGSRSGLPGIIDTQADVGGWPDLKSDTPRVDSDHDGMDDEWERQHQLDPNRPDNNQPLAGGPTALERYLGGGGVE